MTEEQSLERHYGTVTITVDPPATLNEPFLEYIDRIIALYAQSRVPGGFMITTIYVDARGSVGEAAFQELRRRLGRVVIPFATPRKTFTL